MVLQLQRPDKGTGELNCASLTIILKEIIAFVYQLQDVIMTQHWLVQDFTKLGIATITFLNSLA